MTARVKFLRLLVSVVLLSATVSSAFGGQSAYAAAQITNRKLTLVAGAVDGGSKALGVVNHLFDFTLPSATNVGSIKFEYCQIAAGVCNMPVGLITTSATLGSELGAIGFTINKVTNGIPYLTRVAASVTPGAVRYQLNTITNPTANNTSFFVRISTYTSIDTTGSAIDSGVVTATTATQIILTGIMPESLIFCTGATIGLNAGLIPDCSTATAGDINFNQLFSPSDTATATSQIAASTNALSGYAISVYGPTLTSGSNTIAAMAGGLGVRGVSGFGMNFTANTVLTSTIAVGADIAAPSNDGLGLRGKAAAGYDTVDQFKFVAGGTGNLIAKSDFTGSSSPTNAQIYTASYIVNVSGSQISGTYVTTLTYVATATF